jgi:hypothetical protein
MSDLSAVIRLRPARVALLVRPSDIASIRRFMRICACMWGGVYNPIIPVFRVGPKEWRRTPWERARGLDVAKGYVEFFEPDAFVEAEHGLLEEAGLGALRARHAFRERVLPLDRLIHKDEHRNQGDLFFGLNIFDALKTIYESEQRFQLREQHSAYLVRPERGSGLSEAMFGVYPDEKSIGYIKRGYEDVYRPEVLKPSPETWRKIYSESATTPLSTTRYRIDERRSWNDDLIIYVFDPARPTDLIDLWNMRIESQPVLPVPINWLSDLAAEVASFLLAEHRPVQGNAFGVMHHGTVEFARSIDSVGIEKLTALLRPHFATGDPKSKGPGPLVVKPWRNDVWNRLWDESYRHRHKRIDLTVAERRVTIKVDQGQRALAHFEALVPDFAARFGGHDLRWVNSVQVSSFGAEDFATVFPFNTFDRSWPRLGFGGDPVVIGAEGWSFGQKYMGLTQAIELQTQHDAVVGSLKSFGIDAKLSEPGYIAKQILEHLRGLWGVHLLADAETLDLLNTMAGGIRRRTSEDSESEEIFGRRSKPVRKWEELVERRRRLNRMPDVSLDHFTERNILRLGTETSCPHCKAANWHSLTEADYELRCERCLKVYSFPQASARNRNWAYRVIGPFSVPDYAKGSYGALLALHAIKSMLSHTAPMTYSPALTMDFDGGQVEADYVAWVARESLGGGSSRQPTLVIGEAKSFGKGDLIRPKDIAKLKRLAEKLPGAVIAISVLRADFTEAEKTTLRSLVKWGRRLDEKGHHRNPVLLLTTTEMIGHHVTLQGTWEEIVCARPDGCCCYGNLRHGTTRPATATSMV